MQIAPFQPQTFPALQPELPSSVAGAEPDFASILGKHRSDAAGDPSGDPRAQARDAARSLVAVSLVQPMLKKLRESNNAWGPFAPNSAERSFRGVMDQRLAEQIVHARNWPLIDHLTNSLLRARGITPEEPPCPSTPTPAPIPPGSSTTSPASSTASSPRTSRS